MDREELWTPADDETLRGALDTLRWETDLLPLSDVRFVKARGNARHRRAQLVGSMSVAAAVAALGFIGFHSMGTNQSLNVGPAATSTPAPTSAPSAHPTVIIAAPGPLLVAAEWQRALGYTETVKLGEMRSGEGVDTCVSAPGTQIAISYAVLANPHGYGDLYGVQGTYRAGSSEAGNTAAAKAASQIVSCRGPGPGSDYKAEADAAWPKVFRSAPNPKSAPGVWFIVAHQGALISLLSVGDPTALHPVTDAGFSLAQIQALALAAQQRLVQEVEHGLATAQRPSVAATTQTDPAPATTQTAR